jgi:RNase P/RNase MRP subunit POP5
MRDEGAIMSGSRCSLYDVSTALALALSCGEHRIRVAGRGMTGTSIYRIRSMIHALSTVGYFILTVY